MSFLNAMCYSDYSLDLTGLSFTNRKRTEEHPELFLIPRAEAVLLHA
jgi:hypothetical protein